MSFPHLVRFAKAKVFYKKPLDIFEDEYAKDQLGRNYGFWSLVSIGLGGTIGSGVFVLSGEVASTTAGPASSLSYLIAGFICTITALSYGELSAILLCPGGVYNYSYYALGEMYALVAAWMITLSYGVSGSAVCRSWGDKLSYWVVANEWVEPDAHGNTWINSLGGSIVNPGALFISVVTLIPVLSGIKIAKDVVNALVILKVGLVLFVIFAGAAYASAENLIPFVPPPHTLHNGTYDGDFEGGANGVFIGAIMCFFAMIGFDETAAMTADARNPKRDIPLAIVAVISITTVLYVAAAVVLTGMVPYDQLDHSEGFGSAFKAVGALWAMQITVIGEIIVLPTVTLVCYIVQLRVNFAASRDGHLPPIFARLNSRGVLFQGGLITGTILTLVAAFVDFKYLNDLISAGVLLSFIMANASLVQARTEFKSGLETFLIVLLSAILGLLINKTDLENNMAAFSFTLIVSFSILAINCWMLYKYDFTSTSPTFAVPFVPVLPTFSIFINWFLMTQLSWVGLFSLVGYTLLAFVCYFAYGFCNSKKFVKSEVSAQQVEDSFISDSLRI
uniref:Cationic amino acid transporter C-terminal domain-containing protein n=1 Tax=Mucochytrium quahogii TaxID=96639 RepID=A0A7S2RSK6_9STRA|mmetsp:Transcript_20013/g.33015  ORF Transcript_20013/g.33015 Transcript_20013/m.33015 type:complete len:562 (-) Transcript_20013:762-2447(-)|eukprot:CAMPEP_0203748808 /NCGR_PEP_ID=MMETSP0098-20131031/3591_1 /ASSEMBLY_ACC=CAM_ASM_000208 /TAXON_ID=96639 /ORGANISM=" , Strain NY0313808BC1" /LENGTH=561 /DNA_ID=CAMNT_0050637683 /DNA_START=452 /DNA_END=2137 /DNA_ORIENTATION=+